MKTGRIIQISGPVVDVAFDGAELPKIREALYVETDGERRMMEACLHLGNNEVRCIMLGASEGLARDMRVVSTDSSIKVPVGDCTIGRMFNASCNCAKGYIMGWSGSCRGRCYFP